MLFYVDDKIVYDNANTWEVNEHMINTYIERYAKAGHKVTIVGEGIVQTYGPWNEKPYREISSNENWKLRPRGEGYRVD